jgi:hypothetical protein
MTRKIFDGPIDAMIHPVVCQCGAVYDLGAVHVIARHADATVWKAPCCDVTADDRKWVHQPYRDYRREAYDIRGFILAPDREVNL